MRLIDTVMPRLAELPGKRRIFFALKANIRKSQLAKLVAAGVTALQPGIESFADEILRPMKKGVSGLQNIQLLKWCREFGIRASWAILCGFPFETPESYDRMAALVPLLTHLKPPIDVGGVSLQRFSPLYEQSERFGIRDIVPNESYRFIYGAEDESLTRLAYRFEYKCDRPRPVADYTWPLRKAVLAWKSASAESFLVYHDEDGRLTIGDTRPVARRRIHRLSGPARAAYLCCDQIRPRHIIARDLAANGHVVNDDELTRILEELVEDRLMITENGLFLSLAVRFSLGFLPPASLTADMLTRNDRSTRVSMVSHDSEWAG
jgi:ribosomal peptide maturation radical SAM protein 1